MASEGNLAETLAGEAEVQITVARRGAAKERTLPVCS